MRSSGLILYACAGLLLSGGAILGGSCLWGIVRMSYYFWTTDIGVELGASVTVLAGALLCLPCCWLATLTPHNPRSRPIAATLMCLLMSAMLLLSMGLTSLVGLTRVVREPSALNSSMLRAMATDNFDLSARSAFATMQLELKCCGVNSHTDWFNFRRSLPPSCCPKAVNGKHFEPCAVPQYPVGCLLPAKLEIRSYAYSLAALSTALIMILAITLFTSGYSLVTSIMEPGLKPPQPVRIAYLSHTPYISVIPPSDLPTAPVPATAM